jgi:hypothetical protein
LFSTGTVIDCTNGAVSDSFEKAPALIRGISDLKSERPVVIKVSVRSPLSEIHSFKDDGTSLIEHIFGSSMNSEEHVRKCRKKNK